MTFEDAVEVVHNLSNELAVLVDLKGDLAMLAVGTSQYKATLKKAVEISQNIENLMVELDSGLEKLKEELVVE